MIKSIKSFLRSISWALAGISVAFRTQFNFRFHVFSAIIALVLSFVLQLAPMEWCIILFCIASVLTAELLNTSLEFNTDLLSPGQHESAKHVKDLAAAAVLVVSIISAIIGGIIFLPRIITLLSN